MTKTRIVDVQVFEWGPEWSDMQEVARQLGALGLMFQIKWTTPEQQRKGIDILPEIHLYDKRYRTHVVTPGLFVAVHPGTRNFRVLDRYELEAEYDEVQPYDSSDHSR